MFSIKMQMYLKVIDTRITSISRNVFIEFDICARLFFAQDRSLYMTDRQTDGRARHVNRACYHKLCNQTFLTNAVQSIIMLCLVFFYYLFMQFLWYPIMCFIVICVCCLVAWYWSLIMAFRFGCTEQWKKLVFFYSSRLLMSASGLLYPWSASGWVRKKIYIRLRDNYYHLGQYRLSPIDTRHCIALLVLPIW